MLEKVMTFVNSARVNMLGYPIFSIQEQNTLIFNGSKNKINPCSTK
jgi:hypothetical protein